MRITLITPANRQSRAGNRTTAVRWARVLRALGHDVRVAVTYEDERADLMIALHAWRSAAAIERFRARHPTLPLVVGLAGTDVYRFLDEDPATTLRSLDLADALVGLHDRVGDGIPARYHAKLHVIHQSAPPVRREPSPRGFPVCVIGHLRAEKDPFRTALAAGDLPKRSRIRVIHVGKAHEARWAEAARAEMAANPRYRWRGEVPGAEVRRLLGRVRLMVLSSVMEGGANVLSEAVVAGVPVLASEIAGSVGLLGPDYPGYFPVGDTAALTRLLARAEAEPAFLAALEAACAARAPLFTEARERAAWAALLDRVSGRKRAPALQLG
jgi:putative glycosyltransferase (TIGR04348 family)